MMRLLLSAGAALLIAEPALAQAFDPGPPGTVVGSSMAGKRIGPYTPRTQPRIKGARVFGDTVEERAYGRDYDDSYLTPEIPVFRSQSDRDALRASQGRSRLDDASAGAYARSGPSAIGGSAITRPGSQRSHRAVIVPRKPSKRGR
ncbi:hypothetical protein [Mangrovibrevibacter kandeliae]|uniref:hypothetical protein n=1 Tax=Mangrovibrevibacter kandeliae TaxID=2968473 RepID=UPI0021178615|nr:hypothetical protein [Aurantimonas sp. CSK15Z-1]MCQ8783188.1 hypothetical protein [Aurantimonas sp. CSK15Z-1]